MGFLCGWCEHLFVSEVNNAYFSRQIFQNSFWMAKSYNSVLQLLLEHGDFLNIDISQGSVATCLRCGGIFR